MKTHIQFQVLLIEEKQREDTKAFEDDIKDFKYSPIDRDEIFIEFESLDPFELDSPFIPEVHPDDDDVK